MRGWQGQPRKMVEYEHWRKKKPNTRSLGCRLRNLVVLKMACSQSHCKIQSPFSATPCEQFKVLSALFSPKMRCACRSFYLNEAVRNSALLALH
jgi:hypothetical protein